MNIGYVMFYPFRGSLHNMVYFSKIMEREGHSSHYLDCNSSVDYCFNRAVKNNGRIIDCALCMFGGLKTFDVHNISTLKSSLNNNIGKELQDDIICSTSYTLHRIETDEDCFSKDVLETQDKLRSTADIVYNNACEWINKNSLDLVFIYNGRLDMPRAVLKACEHKNIPYFTFEAAYPGVALEINGDCRSLKSMHHIMNDFKDKPLLKEQAVFAANIAVKMIKKKNLVWRLYNTNPTKAKWPVDTDKKILIVPSSNHEFKGVAEWTPEWKHPLEGVESVLKTLGIPLSNCVVRAHPNWSESIGSAKDGFKSERVYNDWCKKHSAHMISSVSDINTLDLIQEADLVIVQYGTAGIEAALLGKKVIGLSPSWYSTSDISIQVHGVSQLVNLSGLSDLDANLVSRKALRFLYSFHKRFAQYTNEIQPETVFLNRYSYNADIDRIIDPITSGFLKPDDNRFADTDTDETMVLEEFIMKEYKKIESMSITDNHIENKLLPIKRRFAFRWVDGFRGFLKGGDQ